MGTASLRFFAFGLVFFLAACGGPVHWSKPDSDDAMLSSDLTACRAEAHSASQRMYGPPQMSSMSGPSPLGGRSASDPSLADRQMREEEGVNSCMRGKGYALVPVAR
jgi:hypothetical protein